MTTSDAFTNEVIRNSLVSITEEMKINLMRAAYTAQIYEAEDFTVGLFDAEGSTLSIGLGLPMFIRGLSDSIKAKIAYWGTGRMSAASSAASPRTSTPRASRCRWSRSTRPACRMKSSPRSSR
jgi:Hydantoinase B/oxoprolinase